VADSAGFKGKQNLNEIEKAFSSAASSASFRQRDSESISEPHITKPAGEKKE
jgi:hypothetical protein